MKRIKEILDLLVSIVKAWEILSYISLIGILATITRFFRFANQSINVSLPLWGLILITGLAVYPLLKLIQFFASRRKTRIMRLHGLLWKTRLIGSPIAICPYEECGTEVIYREIPPKPYQMIRDVNDLNLEYSYQYECPVHGNLDKVTNEPLSILQHKAKLAFKSN